MRVRRLLHGLLFLVDRWNVLLENTIEPARMADEIRASGADIVLLTEARRMQPLCGLLAVSLPHNLGCGQRKVEMLLFSRHAFVPGSTEITTTSRPGR